MRSASAQLWPRIRARAASASIAASPVNWSAWGSALGPSADARLCVVSMRGCQRDSFIQARRAGARCCAKGSNSTASRADSPWASSHSAARRATPSQIAALVWAGDNGKSASDCGKSTGDWGKPTGGGDVIEGGGVVDKAVGLAVTMVAVAAGNSGNGGNGGNGGGPGGAAEDSAHRDDSENQAPGDLRSARAPACRMSAYSGRGFRACVRIVSPCNPGAPEAVHIVARLAARPWHPPGRDITQGPFP
ncbi:hypothetical protein ACFJIX_19900 [Roseateles sp. UC29_93]|uniref:hypothetical protein n=1 Tax=Roseateles sp. UC29_93 TaxID=3350177 RepID=UPI0036733B2C